LTREQAVQRFIAASVGIVIGVALFLLFGGGPSAIGVASIAGSALIGLVAMSSTFLARRSLRQTFLVVFGVATIVIVVVIVVAARGK
jgi:hypothetical protein